MGASWDLDRVLWYRKLDRALILAVLIVVADLLIFIVFHPQSGALAFLKFLHSGQADCLRSPVEGEFNFKFVLTHVFEGNPEALEAHHASYGQRYDLLFRR